MANRWIVAAIAALAIGTLNAADQAADQPKEDTARELKTYLGSLPEAAFPEFNQEQALALVALPLSCVDRPQAVPEQRVDYLWVQDGRPHLLEAYDKNRVFYGCFDWHSS